jgi:uncharacterized integral membrane protein
VVVVVDLLFVVLCFVVIVIVVDPVEIKKPVGPHHSSLI